MKTDYSYLLQNNNNKIIMPMFINKINIYLL